MLSKNWEVSLAASDRLASIGRKKIPGLLIPLLKSKRPDVRNSVALALKEIGDDDAVKPLMNAIMTPQNRSHRGTLVSALEKHDCSLLFLPMVKLALYGDYEVQCHALIILSEQKFATTFEEIQKAKRLIKNYRTRKTKYHGYSILLTELSRYVSRIEKQTRYRRTVKKGK